MKTADERDRNEVLWSGHSSRRPWVAGRAIGWSELTSLLTDGHLAARLRAVWQGSGTFGSVTTGLLVGLAYYAGARLGFLLVFPGSPLSVIWPPNAIVLAALLLVSPRAWWAVLLGVLPAHLLVEWQSGVASWAVPGLYITNCGEALLGATIVRRFAGGGPPWLGTLRQVAVYVIGAAIAAPFVMSFLDTGVVVLTNWASREHYWLLWEERFISAVLTNLTVAPVILIGASRGWGRWPSIPLWRTVEALLLALSILVTSYLTFSTPTPLAPAAPELLYLLAPVLLWAAVRFGVGGICTSLLAVALLAAVGTDGSEFFVARAPAAALVTLQLFLVALGGPAICLAALVQERERDAAALRESETQYRTVVETQTELITRYRPDLTLTFVNDAACRYIGKSRADLLGTRIDADLDSANAARVREMVQALLAQPDPGVLTIEHETPFHDGSMHWQQWVNRAILDADGQVVELQGIGRDITDRKRLEQEREEAHAQAERRAEELDRVFEAMADGVAVYDQDGREVRTNRALQRLLGIDVAPLHYAQMPLHERMALFAARDEHGRPLTSDEGPLPRVLRGEVVSGAETQDLRSRTLDGREIEVSVSAATLRDLEGRVTGAVAVFHDQTARRQLEREREEANTQLRAIQAITDTALAHLDVDDLLPALLDLLRKVLMVDHTAVLLLAEEEPELRVRAVRGLDHQAIATERIPMGQGVAGQVAASREPLIVDDLSTFPAIKTSYFERQQSAASVPLIMHEQLLGVLVVSNTKRRKFSEYDVHMLQRVAERVALSVDRAQLYAAERQARTQASARTAELEAVLGSMTDGVVVYDPAGQIDYMNAAFGTMIAAQAHPDFVRLSLAERAALVHFRAPDGHILPVDQLPQARVLRGEALSSGEAADLVEDALDGRTLMLQAAGSPLRDAAGGITGAVLVYRDVTEQRRLERATRELAAQLHATMDAMLDAVFLYDLDGHVLQLNAAAREFVGEQATTTAFYEQPFPERALAYRMRWPDGRPVTPENWSLAHVVRGEALTAERSQDLLLTDAQGRERVMNYVGGPVLDASGQSVGYVFVGRDVTANRHAEAAMRASEARFRAIFASAAIGAAVVDLTGRPLDVNIYTIQMLGYSADELRAMSLDDFTHPDDVAENEALMRRTLDGDLDSYQLEKRYLHKDGHIVWASVSVALVRTDSGQPAYFVVHFEDITKRKELERERDEQAAQLDRIFTGIADGLVVYDAEGHIMRTNPAARRLLGFDAAPAGYVQSPLADRAILYEARDDQGRPLPPEMAPLSRVLRGEVTNGSVGCDLRLRSLDGCEAEVSASAAPLRDADGRLLGAVTILHDQTERNQLLRDRQAVLEASEAWFHSLADTAPVLMWVSGLDALVTFVNQPWLQFTGRTQEQEVGNGWAEGVHPDDFDRCLQTYLTAFHAREPFTMEYRLRRADGEYRWLLDTGIPRNAPDGTFAGYIGSCIDITERHELEQARASELALREVNERLDTFVAVAAHDLRAPVTVTKVRVQMAQRRVLQAAAQARGTTAKQALPFTEVGKALAATERDLEQLWRLMQQLLDVTRARQGTLALDRKPCDLVALVRAAVDNQRLLTPERTLTLALPDLPPCAGAPGEGAVLIDADADRLGQVLGNYLANADRYSPADQPIEVALCVETPGSAAAGGERMARVMVRDHGPGIAPSEQATIWERFQRAQSAREVQGGMGLGLYIARTIIDLHGGQMGVESTPGQGATFWFTLPLAVDG